MSTATDLSANDLHVLDTTVLELGFSDGAHKALLAAAHIMRTHAGAVVAVLTASDMVNNTSTLHMHVLTGRLHEVLVQKTYISDRTGAPLVAIDESSHTN